MIAVEPNTYDVNSDPRGELAAYHARRALAQACDMLNDDDVALVSVTELRSVAILSNCERSTALAIAQNAISELGRLEQGGFANADLLMTTLSVGVATASVVARNFDPVHMTECAVRCLGAAKVSGTSAVKSIEV
jgi:hypothetical protein